MKIEFENWFLSQFKGQQDLEILRRGEWVFYFRGFGMIKIQYFYRGWLCQVGYSRGFVLGNSIGLDQISWCSQIMGDFKKSYGVMKGM